MRAAVPSVPAALADSYGLTEASTAATVATPLDLAHVSRRPSARRSRRSPVSIRAADGTPVADGAEGEIWLRSQFTMLGYWDDAAATAAVITPDGWVRTGDLGRLRDGRLFMASRRSDLILRGGENVYPAEIEAVLDEHPAGDRVRGVRRRRRRPRAGGRGRRGVRRGERGRAAGVRGRAAGVLQGAGAVAADEEPLPRTATGKVIRRP